MPALLDCTSSEVATSKLRWAPAVSSAKAFQGTGHTHELKSIPYLLQNLSGETPSTPNEKQAQGDQDIYQGQVPTSDMASSGTQYEASHRTSLDVGLCLRPSSAFRVVNSQRKTVRSKDNIKSLSFSKPMIADGDHATIAVTNTQDSFNCLSPVPLSLDLHKTTMKSCLINGPVREERDSLPNWPITTLAGRGSDASPASKVGLLSGCD
ncbi:hypothetical protein DFH28DRAFT_926270 [Melampsora americana]|nr:hypothetical protein DFH28DRAFT_926270 [Melampsora americana]